MNVYWFSGKAFTSGIETRPVDGARLRVYDPEKLIAGAFKYRNKSGLDLALEGLRIWRSRKQSSM